MNRTFIGYKPFPHQKAVHDFISEIGVKAGRIIVVKSKRQVGKSYLIEQELLRHAINNPGSISICLSITFPNCRKMYGELWDGIKDSGVLAKADNTTFELTFKNGSKILFKSAEQRERLRGYTVKNGGILCIDEAAYLPDDVFGIVSPWCDVSNANILMVSTPRLKQGFFYEYYKEGLGESNSVKTFDVNDFDTSFLLSAEKLELYRRLMPTAQFQSEYLGMFVDDLGSVFKVTNNVWWESNGEYDELYVGIDFGAGTNGDYSVVTAFDGMARQVFLEYCNNLNPNEQIEWIAGLLNGWEQRKIRKIYAETNSIGNVYIDLLRHKVNAPIDGFTTTNESKRNIVENMINRVNGENAKFIRDNEQYREMSMYMMEVTPSGKITYNGATGTHDDCVMADAMALYGLDERNRANNYKISFGRRKNENGRKYN